MGSGYRVFTAGEVLTASNVQDYLMDQSVMSFADSTARATSIGTANFEEGMVSYLQNTNQLEVYNGSAWASIAPTSTQGLTLINSQSFSAVATQDVNNVFSSTYDNYRILVSFIANTSEASIGFRFKTATVDSGSNYQYYISAFGTNGTSYTQNSTGASQGIFGRVGSDNYGGYAIDILSPNLARATTYAGHGLGDGSTSVFTERAVGLVLTNTQYTGIQLRADTNSVSGEMSIYGFNK
jgi:hypothetical protein